MTEQPITLASIDGFHVGGERVRLAHLPVTEMAMVAGAPARKVDMNGDHMVGQLYVQRFLQAKPSSPYPIVLLHGGGLTGACWETTPDGRRGWLDFFLRAGYDVYVCDAFERGRASWPPYPEVLPGKPEHRPLDAVWHHFRFGPAGTYPGAEHIGQAYPGQQFPVEHLADFGKQFVARWAGTEQRAMQAYRALMATLGKCWLVGHSQGASYALQLARECAAQVPGVVAIEPAATPSHSDQAEPGVLPAHLAVWGDFIRDENAFWIPCLKRCREYYDAIRSSGSHVRFDELPQLNITGNSHMMMMDANNLLIADHIHQWLSSIALDG